MPDQEEIRRRIRAAMALAGITSWEDLAERTPLSRSTLKDLGTERRRAEETHLRVIAAACDVPYEWFTVPDLRHALVQDIKATTEAGATGQEDDEPTIAERLEALERAVSALARRGR